MKKKIYYIVLTITVILLVLACTNIVFQNDTFYSIKIGQDILKYGIDFKDHYTWIDTLPYTYPHWLFDLIISFIYKIGSFNGIYLFTVLAFIGCAFIEYKCLSNISKNKILSFILTSITIILIRGYASCRAQLLTYPLAVLFYYFILKLNKTNNKKYIVYLGIISTIIVNLHVAFYPFLLLLYLPFFAEKIIYKLLHNKINLSKYVDDYKIKPLIISFVITLFTGLLTPLKLVPYTYLINTMRGVSQFYIYEHQPLTLWSYKLLILYIIFILIVLHNKKIKLNDIFLLLGLSIMMLSSMRHRYLFVLLTNFIIIKYINLKPLKKIKLKNYKYLYDVVIILSNICLIWVSCITIYKDNIKEFNYLDGFPVDAVKYIKNNLDYKNIKIYNNYNYGSYLLLNDIKVMFDSRADLYTKEFNKKYEYFEELVEINQNNYSKILNKYNIDYALIKQDSSLYAVLKLDKNYKEIYHDEVYYLYQKIK